jgi:hypothetical protein
MRAINEPAREKTFETARQPDPAEMPLGIVSIHACGRGVGPETGFAAPSGSRPSSNGPPYPSCWHYIKKQMVKVKWHTLENYTQ